MHLLHADGPVLDAILAATFDIWNEGLDRASYGRYYRGQLGTVWGRTHLDRWALVDANDVLASAKTYDLNATLDRRAIRVFGLGAVFTSPVHRNRGYARLLIEQLLARAAGAGFDVALLFSEIGPAYYERLGFTTAPTIDLAVRVREDARRGAPAMLVRSAEERDLPAIADIDAVRATPYRFHLNRDRDLVGYGVTKKRLLAGLGPRGAREVLFDVAEEGAAAAAYVVVSVRGPHWTIEAAGDRDPSGARVGAMLQSIIARHPAEARSAIAARLPDGFRPPQIEIVGEQPSADVMMIKPLSGNGMPSPPLGQSDVCYWRIDLF